MLLLCAGLLFGGMSYFLPMPAIWRVGIMALVWLITVYYCLRYALQKLPQTIVALHVNSKNQLKLVQKNGEQLEVQVQANTVVTSYLTVLNCLVLNSQEKEATFWQKLFTQHVIILPDAVDAEAYRQLRVWLRWAKGISPQTATLDSAEDKMV